MTITPGQTAKPGTEKLKGLARLKVDASTDRLITQAAHFLGVQKNEHVDEACRFYLEHKREEIRQGMVAALADLDDSTASADV